MVVGYIVRNTVRLASVEGAKTIRQLQAPTWLYKGVVPPAIRQRRSLGSDTARTNDPGLPTRVQTLYVATLAKIHTHPSCRTSALDTLRIAV